MNKPQTQHRKYPKNLISFQNLGGGAYGNLALIARDASTLEIQIGNDFVRVTPDEASQLAEACARFAGPPVEVVVHTTAVEETDNGDVIEVEEEQRRLVRPRRPAPKRRTGV